LLPPVVGRAGGARAEIELALLRVWFRWEPETIGDRAPLHQIGLDEPGEGERAGDDPVGVVGEAQQHEGDQGDRDLNPNGVFRGSEEVADLQGLLDPPEEQLDTPYVLPLII